MVLKGKTAIVTGGAQGIGREYSLRFAHEGARVVVADLRDEQARAVAAEIEAAGGQAIAVYADVSSEASAQAMAEAAHRRFGRIDVLMNNAAIYYDLDLKNQSLDYLRKVLDVNLLGALTCGRAVFPSMKAQGGGSIINIASTAAYPIRQSGFRPQANFPNYAYGLSKSGVVYLTKSMARTGGPYNIRVNAIAPGATMTEATKRVMPPKAEAAVRQEKALGLSLQPGDLAGTAVFLASDESAMMTGQTLVVDAGGVMIG
ncbi:MAG: glucose 1-dehydrogenase [Chloroflexi bacterium]|nr:glucose 1-dehydrogenase [Chloroflexota bacterium]